MPTPCEEAAKTCEILVRVTSESEGGSFNDWEDVVDIDFMERISDDDGEEEGEKALEALVKKPKGPAPAV